MLKKKLLVFGLILLTGLIYFFLPSPSYAANTCTLKASPGQVPKDFGKDLRKDIGKGTAIEKDAITVTIVSCQTSFSFRQNTTYAVYDGKNDIAYSNTVGGPIVKDDSSIYFFPNHNYLKDGQTKTYYICDDTGKSGQAIESWCKPSSDQYIGQVSLQVGGDAVPTDYTIPKLDPNKQTVCGFQTKSDVTLHVTDLTAGKSYQWWEKGTDWEGPITVPDGATETDFTIAGVQGDKGPFDTPDTDNGKTVCVDIKEDGHTRVETPENCISLKFGVTTPSDTSCGAPTVVQVDPPCITNIGSEGCTALNTAIGQIKTTPDTFLSAIFAIFLSLSGGIALLMIIRSGYQLLTSQGNAEKIKEAQDRIISAIVGLLFALFALVILESIGVDILHIPGLSH